MSILFEHENFLILDSVNNTGVRLILSHKPSDLTEVGNIIRNYNIKTVVIAHCYNGNIDWIVKYLPNIVELRVINADIEVDGINDLNQLRVLRLDTNQKFHLDFEKLNQLVYLETIWQDSLIESFKTKSNIIRLSVSHCKSVDLDFLQQQCQIEELSFIKPNKMLSLQGIQEIKALSFLHILSARVLNDIRNIESHQNLRYLSINSCNKITDIPNMSEIYIEELLLDCTSISSLSPLKKWINLKKLVFTAKVEDNDVEVLKDINALIFISFSNKKTYNFKQKDIDQYLEGKGFSKEKNGLMKNLKTLESYRI